MPAKAGIHSHRPVVMDPGFRRYRIHTSLQDRPACFDKLSMRTDFSGITCIPHPELVEGRTAPIPFSGKSLM
jgi:hypothetical protein